jgi:hypothetical protein
MLTGQLLLLQIASPHNRAFDKEFANDTHKSQQAVKWLRQALSRFLSLQLEPGARVVGRLQRLWDQWVADGVSHLAQQSRAADGFGLGCHILVRGVRRWLASAFAFTTAFLQRHGIPSLVDTHAALFVWAYRRRRNPERASQRAAIEGG